MIVADFTLLSPSTSRHQDLIMHVYFHDPDTASGLNSVSLHWVGDQGEKNDGIFVINCLRDLVKMEFLKDFNLTVVYSDGGSKHFKLGLLMDYLVDFEKESGRRIIWNFFPSNHGAGAADGDGQIATKVL